MHVLIFIKDNDLINTYIFQTFKTKFVLINKIITRRSIESFI